jgi:hypothetical protein
MSSTSCATLRQPGRGRFQPLAVWASAAQSAALDNSGVLIEVRDNRQVLLSDIRLDLRDGTLQGVTYSVRNTNGSNLIAFGVTVDTYWQSAPAAPARIMHSVDDWFLTKSGIAPQRREEQVLQSSVTPNQPDVLTRVVVSVDYAEFADGTIVGPDTAGFAKAFKTRRSEKVAVQAEIAAKLRQNEITWRELPAYIEQTINRSRLKNGGDVALLQMKSILEREGPQALAKRILQTPASLP